jgi:hypothetical protein
MGFRSCDHQLACACEMDWYPGKVDSFDDKTKVYVIFFECDGKKVTHKLEKGRLDWCFPPMDESTNTK